jgi:hypothetical protein
MAKKTCAFVCPRNGGGDSERERKRKTEERPRAKGDGQRGLRLRRTGCARSDKKTLETN